MEGAAEWASDLARRVRHEVFAVFAEEGRAPSPAELARRCGTDPDDVRRALGELHDAHAIVLTGEEDAIRMAHPFSAWPMGFVLRDKHRMWWGGCAWDSFGIVAALGTDLDIATNCPHCGADLQYRAGPQIPPAASDVVVRVPLPAAQWWGDVVATCSAIRAFCSQAHARAWLEHSGESEGDLVELERLWRLAMPWYGDRLDPDWQPRTREHSQSILEDCGLTGDFWKLPG